MQGLSILTVVLLVFIAALYFKKGEVEARTLAFATLVFANIMLITVNLSWSQGIFKIMANGNRALWAVVAAALTALMAVIYVPFLRKLFHFSVLSVEDIAITLFGGIISLLWFEGLKALNRKGGKR
jgi:P-type Ca2+ transporter type 2C